MEFVLETHGLLHPSSPGFSLPPVKAHSLEDQRQTPDSPPEKHSGNKPIDKDRKNRSLSEKRREEANQNVKMQGLTPSTMGTTF